VPDVSFVCSFWILGSVFAIASAPCDFLYLNNEYMIQKTKALYFLHAPRPLHLQSLKSQLHVVQSTIPPRPLSSPSRQASRPCSPVFMMEDLPPLPSLGAPSRAPSRQSSSPELTESHLYIRDFVRETHQRLNFSCIQLPIHDDRQLAELSDGETIVVPLSCSALNPLASMTRQLDTITTQLGTIQSTVAILPTSTPLESRLAPINASLRDLSQKVSAAPPNQEPAPTRPPVPPTGTSTRPAIAPTRPPVHPTSATIHTAPEPPPLRSKARTPPPNRTPCSSFDPDIPQYDPDTRAFYGDPRAYADKFPDSWESNTFREGSSPIPPSSSRVTSPLTITYPNPRMPRPPPKVPRRARGIRAPSRPPKSRQPTASPLYSRHRGHSLRPKDDFTPLVLPPLSTHRHP